MQVTPQSGCLREGPWHREWCKGGERSCQPGGRFWQEWRCSLLRKQQEAAWPGHRTHCCEFRASVSQTGGFGVFTLLSEKPRTGPPCREVADTLSGDAVGQPSGFACGVKSHHPAVHLDSKGKVWSGEARAVLLPQPSSDSLASRFRDSKQRE